jgi:iron complex transport system substrate-binding protein
MRKILSLLIAVLFLSSVLSSCGAAAAKTPSDQAGTILFTDSCGRQVELPKNITRIAPSGAVATMILATIAPEYMVSVSSSPSSSQYQYLPKELIKLPTTGQLYGTKSTINLEALLNVKPQVIVDLGDPKDGIAEAMDGLQKQTGIPTIYIRADLAYMSSAYRSLGGILSGKNERGEELASFIEKTVMMANENAAKIDDADRLSIMYTSGTSGLNANARGSIQSQVAAMVGAENAVVVDDVMDKNGGNTIGMEQLYLFDPDVILFAPGSVYSDVSADPAWARLTAIKNDTYYEIPGLPYNWVSNPPSINMCLGILWLGNILYPDLYQYDMKDKAQEFYKLFWNYDLTDEEAKEMLANSSIKRAAQDGGE